MKTSLTTADLQNSVISVPPLCRDASMKSDAAENARLIRHIEAGGVSTLLYGGNANFYNIALSEYEAVIDQLEAAAAAETLVVPSVGPVLRCRHGSGCDPCAEKVSHCHAPADNGGEFARRRARRGFEDRRKNAGGRSCSTSRIAGYVTVDIVQSLVAAGAISWIKYAVVRPDPAVDELLAALVAGS